MHSRVVGATEAGFGFEFAVARKRTMASLVYGATSGAYICGYHVFFSGWIGDR